MTDALPTLADISRAAERIAGKAQRTPLLNNAVLDERVGGRVHLKCENLQRTGSFKFRGAYNAVAALDGAGRAEGVVTVSSGNHGQGIAEAARIFGTPATIVMPKDAPAMKRRGVERRGARIVEYDRATEDRDAVAAKVLLAEGGAFIHPYNDARVIAGQGTIGLEILADAEARGFAPDVVLIPCGGGGLAAGIALALRSAWPAAEILAVEPEGFDDYGRSLAEGRPVTNPKATGSVCDALLAPSPGAIGFALNRRNLSGARAVSDDAALAAVAFAFRELKLVVEPGGAVGLAALLSGRVRCEGRKVVVVLSGGNLDEAVLAHALAMPASSL
jgi:threonine dehydratase